VSDAPVHDSAMVDTAITVFSRDAQTYASVELQPVERLLLATIGPRWGQIRMLDLGVGTGRTTYTFAAICKDYVGIDFVPEMVRRAIAQFSSDARVQIRVGDARSMPELAAASFDVVLFSFNGIDSIDDAGRRQVLAEARRLVKADGIFLFSSHVLTTFPPPLVLPQISWSNPVKALRFRLGAIRQWMRLRYHNRDFDGAAAQTRGWGVLHEAHGFKLAQYYVAPVECVRQLRDTGFHVDRVLDFGASDLRPPYASPDPWLYYWCSAA
jgi:SAM-dependent methyltransferase